MNLLNKVVLITGSSSGIGEVIAKAFAKEGCKVIINCNKNIDSANKIVQDINSSGGQAFFVQTNVWKQKDVDGMFRTIIDKFGTLDILINNAGVARSKKFLETNYDDWIQEFNDNFFGAVLCSQKAAPIMLKQKSGVILNTSSIRGLLQTGREGIMPYSAAKSAINNFTKTLAKELAPNIRVNAVAPGFTYTPNYDKNSAEMNDSFIEKTYIKRFIKPIEIAEAFIYLAKADAVTGEILVVDGGFTLKDG
ncbi:MAG: SDR family NAD(P)-dependent oxidoreductase [Candidatus Paceibacterota bacterium]